MSVFDPECTSNRFEASYQTRPDRPGDPYSFKLYIMYDRDDEHAHVIMRDLSMGDMLRIKREICTAIRRARLAYADEKKALREQ